jgi:hypothetical protein
MMMTILRREILLVKTVVGYTGCVRDHYRALLTDGRLRRAFGCAFVLFLLVEWSSHTMVHTGMHTPLASSASANPGTADDPCHSFVHCDDGGHRGRQVPSPGHDLTPNILLDLLPGLDTPADFHLKTPILMTVVDGLSRPPDPAFHPPELS